MVTGKNLGVKLFSKGVYIHLLIRIITYPPYIYMACHKKFTTPLFLTAVLNPSALYSVSNTMSTEGAGIVAGQLR